MNSNLSQKKGRGVCVPCQRMLNVIHGALMDVKVLNQTIVQLLENKANSIPLVLRDSEYVKDRVGISDRTLYRFQMQGLLPVYQRVGGRKYYLDEDVESTYRQYRG